MNKKYMQEVVEKVVTHLATQGERAVEKGQCRYRTADGLKCAVGCLIRDEDYSYALEGQTIGLMSDEMLSEILPPELINKEALNVLNKLQSLHDSSASSTLIERTLDELGYDTSFMTMLDWTEWDDRAYSREIGL